MSHSFNPNFVKYKFRDLKVYSSTEWLADNKKKYRQVFDRYETTYAYAELSFYNKMFDDEDWEIEVELKCFSIKRGRKEVCTLPFKRKISKYDNVVYIREGWGNQKEGAFWKKGTYYWEAWVEGVKVATKYFYVEDTGKEYEKGSNPYLDIKSLKLYEGSFDDRPEFERTYYKTFNTEETRYVYVEITLQNQFVGKPWQCELFTKFYNNSKELKGQVVRLQRIEKKDDIIKITAGWGSNVKGSWRKDRYTAELIFMDRLLAIVPFDVGDDFVEGTPGIWFPDKQSTFLQEESTDDAESFEDVMGKLDALIGLNAIKAKVRDHASYIQFLQLRKNKGFKEKDDINVHSVFIGNPGTGKTTVAQMMGKLYKKMGLLSKGHVHEVDRVDLVGEYIGQTAPKVKEAIEKARGGVLFIDEAYALARSNDDSKDFGREVIEILVKEMSNGLGDMAVIVAGYPKEMKHFLDSNPGLKSRFKIFFEFSDYLPQELAKIASYACAEKGVLLQPPAKEKVDEVITEAFRNRDRSFGNARFVYDVIEKAKIQLGLRAMANDQPHLLSDNELSVVTLDDISKIDLKQKKQLPEIPIDKELLDKALEELDHLIGMKNIKEQIREMVQLVQFFQESGKNVLNNFFLHTVFVGNPGTGKTTVARILTKIYKALGILERGHMIETDRQGLVAGYVGQTAIKTAEQIDKSMGGVLFIDEAYALTSAGNSGQSHGDFGNEAIQTLLKRMEDHRGEFFVFVAGYPDNMEEFLKANPGLQSRFDKVLKFEDYEPSDLIKIAIQMFEEEGLILEKKANEHLSKYFQYVYDVRDKYFGNARTIRSIVTAAMMNHNLRLSLLPKEDRTEIAIKTMTYEDVESFKTDKDDFSFSNKKTIGFKSNSGGGPKKG
ncbi:MAG: SpoVK/Ycf46/Vps4 family AAA+-type ATPase [Maribacter sp.]|jgi:SpoVK/Ycf46/Vps4 family AAA+-type ATPase